jgi:hypothetical protein
LRIVRSSQLKLDLAGAQLRPSRTLRRSCVIAVSDLLPFRATGIQTAVGILQAMKER